RVRRRSEGATAVRGIVPTGIAVLVQPWYRDRSAHRSVRFWCRACAPFPRRDVGAHGNHCGLSTCRPYGLALGDRPRRRAVADTVATTDGPGGNDPGAMDPCRDRRGRRCEAPREMD